MSPLAGAFLGAYLSALFVTSGFTREALEPALRRPLFS
jgi:hypothetical protein